MPPAEAGGIDSSMVFLYIGQPNQIIQTDIIIHGKLCRQVQRQRPFLPLIFGVEGLVAHEILRNIVLLQIAVFPQITDS